MNYQMIAGLEIEITPHMLETEGDSDWDSYALFTSCAKVATRCALTMVVYEKADTFTGKAEKDCKVATQQTMVRNVICYNSAAPHSCPVSAIHTMQDDHALFLQARQDNTQELVPASPNQT